MPKKILLELKDTRVNRMIDEQKNLERERKIQERQAIQNQILQK